jgi:myosin-crossreactive antigen
MAKYSKKAQEKIEEVMHEFKHGELKSGKDGSGGVVKNRDQAIAIGISEARQAGLKVPKEK